MSTLDPLDWSDLRALGHRMMDDMIDHLANIAAGPVWRKMPEAVRTGFQMPLPTAPTAPEALYENFRDPIQPYVTGNTHPRFMGWVHGGGNPVSMLAELLAGAMNANCGGGGHVAIPGGGPGIARAAGEVRQPASTA